MAGTVIITEETFTGKKIIFEWTSSTGGAADGTTTKPYSGIVQRAVFIPDDTDVPTDLYDVMVNDSDDADVLDGGGANLDNSAYSQITPLSNAALGTMICNTKLTLAVTNAGSAKKGKVIIYLR